MTGLATTSWYSAELRECHLYVIAVRERWLLPPSRSYEPLPALLAHLDAIGATRAVVVQPSV